MNIHENTALLDAFVDGELTSEEMISVQSHLDECPECRAYVDDVLAIRASFPTEDDAELPADFVETVMKAVAETPQSRPKKRQPWGKLAAAAAEGKEKGVKGLPTQLGIEMAAEMIAKIKEEGICDGVHIMAIGAEKNVPKILEKAGITIE